MEGLFLFTSVMDIVYVHAFLSLDSHFKVSFIYPGPHIDFCTLWMLFM